MAKKSATITDPDLAKVGVALKRAAANARQLGFATNTPVYVFRDGKIIDIVAEHRATRSSKKPTAKLSQRKKTSHAGKVTSKKIR
jgi:hypothetical protein